MGMRELNLHIISVLRTIDLRVIFTRKNGSLKSPGAILNSVMDFNDQISFMFTTNHVRLDTCSI